MEAGGGGKGARREGRELHNIKTFKFLCSLVVSFSAPPSDEDVGDYLFVCRCVTCKN